MKRYIRLAICHILNEDTEAQAELASDPSTPAEDLKVLSTSSDFTVLKNLSLNPNTPIEVLRDISMRHHGYFKEYISMNPNITPELISEMLNYLIDRRYQDDTMILHLANNKNTDAENFMLMTQYAIKSNNYDALLNVCLKNPTYPTSAMQMIVNSRRFHYMDSIPLFALYHHPNVTPEIKALIEKKCPAWLDG